MEDSVVAKSPRAAEAPRQELNRQSDQPQSSAAECCAR